MGNLIADFSINVTEMFVIPPFLSLFGQGHPGNKGLPGNSNLACWLFFGEEVYSMAILLHEEGLYEKTRIFATDLNATMLEKAKQGTFPLDGMQRYTKNYIGAGGKRAFSEYYKAVDDQVFFHSYLQKNVVFAQHNLVTDHSFNEFDIIICRNVLIYFNKRLQNDVHKLFYDSLSISGFLGLGNREGIKFTSYENCYGEFDATEKLFRKFK